MNRTVKTFSVTAALLCFAAIGCTDPTVAPKRRVSSANVFNDPNAYRAFLAKIYGGLIVTGQRGPDGNPDISGIIGQLPPRGPSTYGRATPEAAHMLLAKLYLNAGVYTGTPNFTGAVTEAQAVINAGYSLPTSFRSNFTADNNVSPELIFVAAQDGRSTQTWGGMTFLIHAGCGGSMSAASYGIDYCWGGYRMKQQTYRRFAAGDTRAAFFYTTGQTDSVSDRGDFTKGIADTDFPIFRLADAYLIYAEANIRGGGGSAANALTYLNAVRQRAYGNTTANFAALPPVDTILAERGRELMFEAQRRSDLV